MVKFEVISIEEALEATKETRWLDEKFGEEYEMDFGDCNCDCKDSVDRENKNV